MEMDPAELVVDAKPAPGDASDGSSPALVKIVGPIAAAAAAAKLVSPLAGLVTLGLAVGLVVALRTPNEGRTVLRIDGADLELRRERRREPLARFPLTELADVALDRETRQAAGRAATERVHLALVRIPPAQPLLVPEERITPLEAEEWHGRVRVFLRRHGWVPADER
jgi:hypothetical protein